MRKRFEYNHLESLPSFTKNELVIGSGHNLQTMTDNLEVGQRASQLTLQTNPAPMQQTQLILIGLDRLRVTTNKSHNYKSTKYNKIIS